MKTSELLVCAFYLLACLLSVCLAGAPWRPQGRFGKRQIPNQMSFKDTKPSPDFGFSQLSEIPVELFFSRHELAQGQIKPELCSVSGLPEYPMCSGYVGKEPQNTETYFDM